MLRTTRRLTAAAVAVLVALPLASTAQMSPTAQTARERAQMAPAPDEHSPQHHLTAARRVLETIRVTSLDSDIATKFATLKRDLSALEASYYARALRSASTTIPPTGATATAGSTAALSAGGWPATYAAVEDDLNGLIGAGHRPVGTSGSGPGIVGTTGTAVAGVNAGGANLEATVRGRLQEFRSHLQTFFAIAAAPSQRDGSHRM